MTHPITELAAAAFIVCAAVGTMFAVAPKPKPEPPSETMQEALKRCEKQPDRMCVVKVEPQPPDVTEKQKVEQIQKDLDATKRDLVEIKNAIRLQQVVKSLPNESGGPK